tara:strand:+ start:4435 stop:5439 length:1005 start_codon:yes stop_codon:yes gene_type:complete
MANEAENIDIEITEEKIEKAAMPINKRVEEEVQEESVEISLDEIKEQVSPVTEDEVKEDFEVSPKVEEEAKDLSEVEKRASLAQNRINKAVAQAKEFQRRELMAVQYAKDLKDQNEKLRQQQKSFSSSYSDEFTNRVESQMTLAKQALKQATEAGDAEAIAAATEALTLATTDKARLEQYSQAQKQYEAQEAAYLEQQKNEPLQQTSQEVEEYNEPSPKAREWAQKNTWFGQDQVATSVAFAIHKQLENEGFDTDSDEYYSEIDKRVRQELPHKFNVEADKKPVQTVASPTRTTSTGRKQKNRIELTPSEQQLAKKLGVSFKDYAIQKARLQKS